MVQNILLTAISVSKGAQVMRNDDWINHAEDVPEEVLQQAAEKEFINQHKDINKNFWLYEWYKSYKMPIIEYIGLILLCLVGITLAFWPYIKEWVSDLIARIPWFQGVIF